VIRLFQVGHRSLWQGLATDSRATGLYQGPVQGLVFIGRVSSPLGTHLSCEVFSSEKTLRGEATTWRASSS